MPILIALGALLLLAVVFGPQWWIRHVLAKHAEVKRTRDAARATRALDALEAAAADDRENLMPLLVECCHSYATVGEMVERLKRRWGEFQEPVQL